MIIGAYMKKYITILILFIFFLQAAAVHAADFSTGREGEIIRPLETTEVTLLEGRIDVKLDFKKANFICTTIVQNLGPGVEMFVGYPAEEVKPGGKTTQTFRDFITYIDGDAVPFMETSSAEDSVIPENPNYNKWYLWPIMLENKQKKEIKNVFWTENTYDSLGNALTGFILKPAKFWNGVGKIEVRYIFDSFEPYTIISAFPANYHFVKNDLVFDFENTVPNSNIKLSFNPDYEYQLANLPLSEIKRFWEIKASGKYNEGIYYLNTYKQKNTLTKDALTAIDVQKGILLFVNGNNQEAESLFKTAIENSTHLSAPYYHLASIFSERKEYDSLKELLNTAMDRHINPIVLRKIESCLETIPNSSLPTITPIAINDSSRFTIQVEDKNADIQKISLQVWTKENSTSKILMDKDVNLNGQAYQYYINENIAIPVYIRNAFCKITVLDGNGQRVEKIINLPNNRNRILSTNVDDAYHVAITLLIVSFILLSVIFFRRSRRKKIN